jgi:hypothetical protein
MCLDGHHGAAGGFSADGAKRRCIAFSDLHAQGCALRVFVMRRSIGKFVAAQQAMVFISLIKATFPEGVAMTPSRQRRVLFRHHALRA